VFFRVYPGEPESFIHNLSKGHKDVLKITG
jgi:hypothetical protein